METKKRLQHPLGKRVNTTSKEPLKNVERQIKHVRVVAQNVNLGIGKKELMSMGYSPSYAQQVSRVRSSKSFAALLEEYMPDDEVLEQHNDLMRSRKLDHMIFPSTIEDEEIAQLLADVNCVLRKVVHNAQAKHAYFWSPDNRARKDALDMIYKLKGKYAPEKFEDVSPYKNLSTSELLERKKAALAFFKKKNDK